MANTLHGPYTPTTWVSGTTAVSQTNMNNLEKQDGVALASFNPDQITSGFVLTGVTPTRHNGYAATVAAQVGANLQRYYRLDEASGIAARDSSGNAQPGVYVGSPTLGVASLLVGDPDTCVTFAAASSQYISVPNTSLPTGNAAVSISAWFKIAAVPASTSSILIYGNAGTLHQALSMYINTSGQLALDPGAGASAIVSAAVTLNTPHFAVGTWNGTTLTLYLDGASVATSTPGAQAIPAGPTVNIGATGTPTSFFSGQLDEVLIANAALSGPQVTALYTAGTTATTQLDIASGKAYLVESDATVTRCDVGATFFTTVTISTTYHLYLQPDGSWYWNTANSPAANSLAICSVTTDSSGNVNLVTDLRPTTIAAFPAAVGAVDLPPLTNIAGLGGQTSVGSFGAPVIVAQAPQTHVTSTAQQLILSYLPVANGFYRVSVSIDFNNATNTTLDAQLRWTSTISGVPTAYFTTNTWQVASGINPDTVLKAVAVTGSASFVGLATQPLTIYASAGGAINMYYTDSAGTPSDFVSVLIERLS